MNGDAEGWRAFRERGGVADLGGCVKLRLTGADRVRYLNGQVTADVRKLTPERTLPACVTTAKGRLCGTVTIAAAADALFVEADASLRDTLPARLERYIIADDVTLDDLSGEMRVIHFAGPAAANLAPPPGAIIAAKSERLGVPGLDLWLPAAAFAECWPQWAAGHLVLDESLRELLRIEAGIPRWGAELGEDTLPPEAGLDRTHIDYHKGCYIGQEVISRLKSVGHVNRELTGFVATTDASPARGAHIFAAGETAGRPLGTITSAAWSFALEKPIALGYLRRGSATRDLIARPEDSAGPDAPIAAHPLPF
jgi:folate-binding protein YgfZ